MGSCFSIQIDTSTQTDEDLPQYDKEYVHKLIEKKINNKFSSILLVLVNPYLTQICNIKPGSYRISIRPSLRSEPGASGDFTLLFHDGMPALVTSLVKTPLQVTCTKYGELQMKQSDNNHREYIIDIMTKNRGSSFNS